METIYGYANGKATYSRDEFIYKSRGFGEIATDNDLIAYAEKVTSGWQYAGWKRSFTHFYLGNYALSEPYASLTEKEYKRLKELQKEAEKAEEMAEREKGWKLVGSYGYADNSVEEIYESKDGERKTVMAVLPHGDAC